MPLSKKQRLTLNYIDLKYIRDLSNVDDHVMSVSPQIGKSTRPFVGIIVICGTKKYCIPLSSPKTKHIKMKNDVDFSKIIVNGKLIGILNFNNMIPVEDCFLSPINLKILPKDDAPTKHYKILAAKQLTFCQQNHIAIEKKANKLYSMIIFQKANHALKSRCCDFLKLEMVLSKLLAKK